VIHKHKKSFGNAPFFHGMAFQPKQTNQVEQGIFTLRAILRFVVASAAEAKLGALFLNCKQATIF
jgi:hypothetical protein